MKLTKLGVLSATALLAGGLSMAVAAETSSPSSSGTSPSTMQRNSSGSSAMTEGKCWDAATNTVKDKSTQTASGQRQSGGTTTGAGTSGGAANSSGSTMQTKPAGMANC